MHSPVTKRSETGFPANSYCILEPGMTFEGLLKKFWDTSVHSLVTKRSETGFPANSYCILKPGMTFEGLLKKFWDTLVHSLVTERSETGFPANSYCILKPGMTLEGLSKNGPTVSLWEFGQPPCCHDRVWAVSHGISTEVSGEKICQGPL